MQDGERHAGTATGIDCVSACVQYCVAGFSSKIVTGGHGMTVAVERWPHVKSPARLSRIYSSLKNLFVAEHEQHRRLRPIPTGRYFA
jgi:hypothetical protein